MAASFNSYAMDEYIESALIDVCKSVKSDSVLKFQNTAKSYHLKDKTIALKVMCNGDDIITFAENNNAKRTAARLQKSLGTVDIIDVVSLTKINATFSE
jgi:hypothetical protein